MESLRDIIAKVKDITLRNRLIFNLRKYPSTEPQKDLKYVVSCTFTWSRTLEGYEYWSRIHDLVYKGKLESTNEILSSLKLPVRVWYDKVKDSGVRAKLFTRLESRHMENLVESLAEAIEEGIDWQRAREGHIFWFDLYEKAFNNKIELY